MKYSFMSFSCPQLTLDDLLATAKRFGYDGIEPRIQSKHAHGLELDCGAEVRREAREKASAAGIALCCVATSCKFADPKETDAMVEDARRAIDLAGDIGAPRIRVFGGAFPEGVSREEATDRVAKALSALASHAAERNVIVCMETHDAWCNPHDVAGVMTRVKHANIAVNWDIMHPIRQGNATMDEAFEALRPWIRHVHFHDGKMPPEDKLMPIGEGAIDHQRAVALLHADHYESFLSGEWIGWEPYETHLPRELATMKRYEAALP